MSRAVFLVHLCASYGILWDDLYLYLYRNYYSSLRHTHTHNLFA